jgi:hypothetical protein
VIAENRGQQHQNPLVDRIDEHDALALAPLLNGFANPRGRAFLLALVHDRAERRVDVVARSPLARQAVEAVRKRARARIEREAKLGVQLGVKRGRRDPVMLPVLAVADVKLVRRGRKLRLMHPRR